MNRIKHDLSAYHYDDEPIDTLIKDLTDLRDKAVLGGMDVGAVYVELCTEYDTDNITFNVYYERPPTEEEIQQQEVALAARHALRISARRSPKGFARPSTSSLRTSAGGSAKSTTGISNREASTP